MGTHTTFQSLHAFPAESSVSLFHTLSFAYDTLNRMCSKAIATTATACSATSSSNPTTWYSHDLDGHLTAANDNSAAITAPGGAALYTTSITYDFLNNPTNISWNPAPSQTTAASASVTFGYSYDTDNRRINQTATNSAWWSYPAASATKLTYNANTLNQYTCIFASTCSTTLLYDANGNLTYDGTFTYTYDAQSRLTEIENGMTVVATYAYDAQGRRKSKTVGTTTTNYVTDANDREVLEYSGSSGAQQNWYAYGLGSNNVLNQMNLAGGTRETMVPDVQGSVIAALDAATGALSTTGYQTYGENPSLAGGTFQYTAQRFDPETAGSSAEPSGLYYYRARMYSPTLGRFLQVDPTGYQNGMNLYAYVGNDPVDRTDPFGLAADSPNDNGTINLTEGDILGSYAAGFGNAVAQTATNLAYDVLDVGSLGGLSQDFSGPPQVQPFSVTSDYFASEGATTFQGVSAVAGGVGTGEAVGSLFSTTSFEEGIYSLYDTSGGMNGIKTDVTANEFSLNLQANGYTATNYTGSNGPATVLQNGKSTYSIYTRTSTGSSGASYIGPLDQRAKYNLGQ